MMLMRDPPFAGGPAQPDRQPEQKPALLGRIADAAHDRDGEGDVVAGGDRQLTLPPEMPPI